MRTKIEIKSVFGKLLFEFECENNSIKKTVEEAVKQSASLQYADLQYADLQSASLQYADLQYADLQYASLQYADLQYASLQSADLQYASLQYADLQYASLQSASLQYADLQYASLQYASLQSADLQSADLQYASHNEGTGFLLCQCPSEGSFIAWKKAHNMIIKIEICEDSKRSSATTLKCRCSKAKCLEIQDIDGTVSELKEIRSDNDLKFIYKVGEINEVLDFDDERFNECSTGIHFFIRREMAVKY